MIWNVYEKWTDGVYNMPLVVLDGSNAEIARCDSALRVALSSHFFRATSIFCCPVLSRDSPSVDLMSKALCQMRKKNSWRYSTEGLIPDVEVEDIKYH
jgi:hypothetical protein